MRLLVPLSLLLTPPLVASLVLHSKTLVRRPLFLADEKDLDGIRGLRGYYRRPSRAIEKGGGFFVPGLEDEKIRVLSASLLLVGGSSSSLLLI